MSTGGLADKIRRGEPFPWYVAWVLRLATVVQHIGMWRRRRQRRVRVPAYVISYGNITAGGVGKTPLVIERAKKEFAAGKNVAVLTRGYGSARTREPLASTDVAVDDRTRLLGDEAALILYKLPDVLVVKGRDRVASARLAIERGCDTLILDDGYQSLRLARDENVLVIDATLPFGHGALIPRGLLRETLQHIHRATHIVLTRCDQVTPQRLVEIEREIRRHNPHAPMRRTIHAPVGLRRVSDGAELPLDWLRGREIAAACAIGNPEAFRRTLEHLGANVTRLESYRDHAQFSLNQNASMPTIITDKDAIRFNPIENHEQLFVIEVRCDEFEPQRRQ